MRVTAEGDRQVRWLCRAGGRDWSDADTRGAAEAGGGRRDPPLESLEGAALQTPCVWTSGLRNTERTISCSLKRPSSWDFAIALWETDPGSVVGQR